MNKQLYRVEICLPAYTRSHDTRRCEILYPMIERGNIKELSEYVIEEFINSPPPTIPFRELPEWVALETKGKIRVGIELGKEPYTTSCYKYPYIPLSESEYWELFGTFWSRLKEYFNPDLTSLMKYISSTDHDNGIIGMDGTGITFTRYRGYIKLRQYSGIYSESHIA